MRPVLIDKISRVGLMVLSVVMAFATFACFYLALLELKGIGFGLPAPSVVAGILAVTILMIVATFRSRIAVFFLEIERIPHLFWIALALGIAMRIAWWWLTLPEVQVSDGASYLKLANMLYAGQDYSLLGHAFWPPGTPLVYAAFLFLMGQHSWIALPVNLLSFILCAISVRAIFARLGMPSFAGLSVALLAIWPELFFTAGQVSKETLLLSLLSGGFALLLSRSGWLSIVSGMVCGLAALTQPALLFLPLLFGFGIVGRGYPSKQILLRLFAVVIGMALVISPWTYRNYRVFGEFVPISTNLGLTLHAANQPAMVLAMEDVGEFIMPAAPQRPFKDDLESSRWHMAEAVKFIKEYPGDFLFLVRNRLTRIVGDDGDSAFRSLRSTQKASRTGYAAAKALSNAYWLMLTSMLCIFCWNFRDQEALRRAAPVIFLATLATLYAMGVFGIVEGSGRHHMGWSWIYSVLLTLILSCATKSVTGKVPTSTKVGPLKTARPYQIALRFRTSPLILKE